MIFAKQVGYFKVKTKMQTVYDPLIEILNESMNKCKQNLRLV